MADFRRCMIVLAALALLLGTVSTVSAAGFQCQTNAATPQQARQQGITELMGDLVLNCTGGVATDAGVKVQTVNITVTLNTEVTSRLLDDNVNGSEAILLVDDPAEGTQSVCFASAAPCTMWGQGAIATSTYLPGAAPANINKNVFQGQWNSNQPGSIVFRGVPIDPPGTNRALLVMRVTNVRGNATRFAVSTGVGIGGIPIFMTIAVSNPSALPINNPQQIVAYVFNGLVQKQDDQVSFKQCNDVNVSGGKLKFLGDDADYPDSPGFAGYVKAIEGFASAFKIRTIATTPVNPSGLPTRQDAPGANYPAVESGFYNPGDVDTDYADTRIATLGLADAGTRVKVELNNVPVGVHVYVPLVIASGLLQANLVKNEAGAYSAAGASSFDAGGGLSEVTISAGAGVAVYEIVAEDPSNTEEIDVPIIIAYIANPAGNSPSITSGPSTGGVSFAPTTTPPDYASEDSGTPVPRFLDTSTQANRFSVNACRTNLLYPFVSNQAGYDTGLAVANTSQDPYGTITQHGTCALNFFNGSTTPPPPATFTTADVGAGSVYTNLLSIVAPGFQGYIIAVCNFQYAHGYAFLLGGTPGGANQVAQGYIALIIPDPGRGIGASPFDEGGPGSGEQLGF
ncbi:MAG: hypothetical protein LAP39_10875 [Acidobacteriia bacterium]|nr:hypothetical protein [Terriglobia bacterium]